MESLPHSSTPLSAGNTPAGITAPAYELELARNWSWGMNEAGKHFDERSKVFEAMRKIAGRLSSLKIPYAVVGGMALFKHGVRRFTEDVDLLVTAEDLKKVHEHLDGLGYLRLHAAGKHLRDTQLGVKIEFLTTGGFPGDGKPKPISFPSPTDFSETLDDISFIQLPKLIELKLASGMTNMSRYKDLADVQELMKTLHLPADYANQLHPYVQDKFLELWHSAQGRYLKPWPLQGKLVSPLNMDALIKAFPESASELKEMQQAGITAEAGNSSAADSILLVTTDATIAEKYNMIAEFDYWDQAGS